jgi:deoxyribose-phosphate aldolase
VTFLKDLLLKADEYHTELPPFPEGGVDLDTPLHSIIDQTLLRADALPVQVEQFCDEARLYQYAAVSINPIFLPLVTNQMAGSGVRVGSVVGFPLGANSTQTKVFEARSAMEQGAVELDMVIPIGLLKGGQYQAVLEDIQSVTDTAHQGGAIIKVVIETCMLKRREKIIACLLCQAAGAEFVKTSTGFGAGGATVDDIDLMRRVVGPISKMGVKAAGGVRSLEDTRALRKAGANRLGTSAGGKIMKELAAETR